MADGAEAHEVRNPLIPGAADAKPATRFSWKRRITWIAGIVALLAAAVVLPGLVNMNRYQSQVTALVSRSLGRPARLSSVELRLLPSPGFVLHDLAVSEDPAFGAEPVLSARTVVASVRIFSLWRGKLEISRISVDEASLNLVRNQEGRWNLESLMLGAQPVLTAAPGASATRNQGKPARFPYLEATSSRINLKQGLEKSPFSLVDTDFSLWQDEPGKWRVRLKGQPVRTDVEMSQADAGEVRMEAALGTAESLRDMPLNLQMDWRDGQLGQLSRLASGTDAGWRGDVRANIDIRGTVDNALTKVRLQTTGVRREEFAPETPQDFDANCSFRYQHSHKAFHDIGCDTVIGDGRLHLKAELPGDTGPPEAMLEVKQVQLQAILDLLRTMRSGFAPEMTAKGVIDGSLTYKETPPDAKPSSNPASPPAPVKVRTMPVHSRPSTTDRDKLAQPPGALTGSLTLTGVTLKGGGLTEPLILPETSLVPVRGAGGLDNATLSSQFALSLPAGTAASAPLQPVGVSIRFNKRGYEAIFSGTAPIGKIRQLAYAFGLPHLDEAGALTSGLADLDLSISGPWIAGVALPAAHILAPGVAGPSPDSGAATDIFSGTLRLRRVEWAPAYLALPVELAQGVVTLAPGRVAMTSDFSYGDAKLPSRPPLKGVVEVTASPGCTTMECEPQVRLRFGSLDAAAMQAVLLDPPAHKSILSPLLNRITPGSSAKLPAMALTVEADSLELGALSLHKLNAHLRTEDHAIVLESWDTTMLGGSASGTAKVSYNDGPPKYTAEGSFSGLTGSALGSLLGVPWTGGPVSGSGSVSLSGLNGTELAASAVGSVKFEWTRGSIASEHGAPIRFDLWSGDFAIKGGKAELGPNVLTLDQKSSTVAGSITIGGPVRITPADATGSGAPR